MYRDVAAMDPEGFASTQHDFITRTHYDPVEEIGWAAGFDTSDRGVQEALYSMSVQHSRRGNEIIIGNALAHNPDLMNLSPQQQIAILYSERTAYAVANNVAPAAGAYRYAQEEILARLNSEQFQLRNR